MKTAMAVVGLLLSMGALVAATPGSAPSEARLAAYRAELDAFRREYGGPRELLDVRFFLFGMGERAKFIYQDGHLLDARSGKVVREWKLKSDIMVPPDYCVFVETASGDRVSIAEDEQAVWIEESGQRSAVEGTPSSVKLPTFAGYRCAQVLRVLYQELLVNITSAGPVPNFFVYSKPWYRDGAMMALVFRSTTTTPAVRATRVTRSLRSGPTATRRSSPSRGSISATRPATVSGNYPTIWRVNQRLRWELPSDAFLE